MRHTAVVRSFAIFHFSTVNIVKTSLSGSLHSPSFSPSPKTGVTTIIYMQTGGKKILTFHFFFTLSERTEIAAKKKKKQRRRSVIHCSSASVSPRLYERNNRTSVAVVIICV